jgi:hypothetical protein
LIFKIYLNTEKFLFCYFYHLNLITNLDMRPVALFR